VDAPSYRVVMPGNCCMALITSTSPIIDGNPDISSGLNFSLPGLNPGERWKDSSGLITTSSRMDSFGSSSISKEILRFNSRLINSLLKPV